MSSTKRKSDGGALSVSDSNANKKPKVNASITSFFGPPKAAPSTSSSSSAAPSGGQAEQPAPKFDKEKWVAGLTNEQRQFLSLEIETLDPSWLAVLKDEITTREFIELKKFLDREAGAGKKIFPPREDIYSWSRHTPFHSVKCVILGQDPYHNVNQAHGLAFSVRPPTPAPPSLRNMYVALKRDYPSFSPPPGNGGLLTPWADRGVLLLNTCLTVRAHEANSHANRGWERFTQRVIDVVAQRRTRGVVFMAWGTPAGKRVQRVDRRRHLVLQSVHPSPLSAARGFFDCGHFRKANDWLAERYGPGAEIDWDLNPASSAAKKEKDPAPASTATKAKKEKREEEEEKDGDKKEEKADVPPPVVAVGELNGPKKQEKSKLLEKEGEDGKADVEPEAEAEAEKSK
ncbi:hypothetical protein DL768_000508 [Monosporascus sp. mg162]|nr:hypothetical protein DL768_000508 [Monosporascus sp. mg162]